MKTRLRGTALVLLAIFAFLPGGKTVWGDEGTPCEKTAEELFGSAQILGVWLTHSGHEPDRVTLNWATDSDQPCEVQYGASPETLDLRGSGIPTATGDANLFLHRTELAISPSGGFYYRIKTPRGVTETFHFRGYPTEGPLRVALMGDLGYCKNKEGALRTIFQQDIHLLVTLGDNVPRLWNGKIKGDAAKRNVRPYLEMVQICPVYFAVTPILPIPGNHDHEIRRREERRVLEPGEALPNDIPHDIDATAFRLFFPLPDEGWKWTFTLPRESIRLIALDLNHLSDQGTAFQTCHPADRHSEQFSWFQKTAAASGERYRIVLYNEGNQIVRELDGGIWNQAFLDADVTFCATGFGYYAEQAVTPEGKIFLNSSLEVNGDTFPDRYSEYLQEEGSFILLTCPTDGTMKAEFRRADNGSVLKWVTF